MDALKSVETMVPTYLDVFTNRVGKRGCSVGRAAAGALHRAEQYARGVQSNCVTFIAVSTRGHG